MGYCVVVAVGAGGLLLGPIILGLAKGPTNTGGKNVAGEEVVEVGAEAAGPRKPVSGGRFSVPSFGASRACPK